MILQRLRQTTSENKWMKWKKSMNKWMNEWMSKLMNKWMIEWKGILPSDPHSDRPFYDVKWRKSRIQVRAQ